MQIKRGILTSFAVISAVLIATPAFAQVSDDYGIAAAGTYCPTISVTMIRGARDASTNGQVSELQKFLADYYDIDPLKLVTGYFGRITQGYLTQFQKEQGLPAFGIAGSLTRAKIASVCNQASSDAQPNTQTNAQTNATSTNPAPKQNPQTSNTNVQNQNNSTQQQNNNNQGQNNQNGNGSNTGASAPSTPSISYTLKQASYYHFSSASPINNTNIAYELAYVVSPSFTNPIDGIQVHLGGNISDGDVALVYLDKAGVSNPDYNGSNLNDVISQRTVAYTTTVVNGVADIHLNPAIQTNQTSFPEIVIVFKSSANGKWTAATGIDFYYQGTKFNQNVSIYNPNPTPVTSTTPPPTTTPPPATTKATSTLAVWNNVAVKNDETSGGTFDVTGYKTGDLHITWTGALTHTCQWKATPVANNNGTFYYFADQSCNATTTVTFLGNNVYISAWTPANGTLNGTLTLYP